MGSLKGHVRSLLAGSLAWLMAAIGFLAGLTASASPALAAPITVEVQVTEIEDFRQDLDEGLDGIRADFYGTVTVGAGPDAASFAIPQKENDDIYRPMEEAPGGPLPPFKKDFEQTVDTVPVTISVGEDDGNVFNGDDDRVDLEGVGDDFLNLFIHLHDPAFCVTGDLQTVCNADLTSKGTRSEAAEINLKIIVDIPFSSQVNTHIRCTHSPAWPQPGDTVTITAESLGDQPAMDPANPSRSAPMPPKLARTIEIWAGSPDRVLLAHRANDQILTGTVVAGDHGSELTYYCKLTTHVEPRSSGFRKVTVGNPPPGNVVAISKGGERKDSTDIVLFPAMRNALLDPKNPAGGTLSKSVYSGPKDPAFLAEVGRILKEELFRHQVLLDKQDKINLWVLLDAGVPANQGAFGGFRDLDPAVAGEDFCQIEEPANLRTDAMFFNAAAVVHNIDGSPATFELRQCAARGLFSTEQGEPKLFVHEVGHAAFGLADEYCCNGGYYERKKHPNVYKSETACQTDALRLGYVAGACNGYEADNEKPETSTLDFWVSDPSDNDTPPKNDLMNNNETPQAADKDRITWILDNQCRSEGDDKDPCA